MKVLDGFTLSRFKDSLLEAKKSTYASGKKPVKLPMGAKEFVFEDEYFLYTDTYHEEGESFSGLELVYFKELHNKEALISSSGINHIPMWHMKYDGRILVPVDQEREKQIYSLLKKSLLKAPREFPARGPIGKPIIEGDLQYENFSDECDIRNFSGEEMITLLNENGKRSEVLYELDYKGQFFNPSFQS